jgi:hypothetical protein
MSESQCAVFLFDVKTMVMTSSTPQIFESLPDAERFCQEQVHANPAQGCRIYDHAGKIVHTLSNDQVYAKHHGRPAAKRSVVVGSLCLLAGAGGVALDAWLEWRLVFGVLLGVRFLWVGTVKVSEGIASLMDERARTLRS